MARTLYFREGISVLIEEEAGWAVRVGLGLLEKRKLSCPAGIRNLIRLDCDAVTVPTMVVRLPETLKCVEQNRIVKTAENCFVNVEDIKYSI